MPINEAREETKRIVDAYLESRKDDRITSAFTKDPDSMRVDYSTMHEAGGLRTPYSVAYPTGLVCLPIVPEQVADFDKKQATIFSVMERLGRMDTYAAIRNIKEISDMFVNLYYDGYLPESWSDMIGFANEYSKFPAKKVLTDLIWSHISKNNERTGYADQFGGAQMETPESFSKAFDDAVLFVLEVAKSSEILAKWIHNKNSKGDPAKGLPKREEHILFLIKFVDRLKDLEPNYAQAFYHRLPQYIDDPTANNEKRIRELIDEIKDAVSQEGKGYASIPQPKESSKEGTEHSSSVDPLSEYRGKREFDQTPEPKGEVRKGDGGIYAVQAHDALARGLHKDLRIEHEGVLASFVLNEWPKEGEWVKIPKVEDHPIQYVTESPSKFEITSGYGAGTVRLETIGKREILEWEPDKIKVRFMGGKYPGLYDFVKMGGKVWKMRFSKE